MTDKELNEVISSGKQIRVCRDSGYDFSGWVGDIIRLYDPSGIDDKGVYREIGISVGPGDGAGVRGSYRVRSTNIELFQKRVSTIKDFKQLIEKESSKWEEAKL